MREILRAHPVVGADRFVRLGEESLNFSTRSFCGGLSCLPDGSCKFFSATRMSSLVLRVASACCRGESCGAISGAGASGLGLGASASAGAGRGFGGSGSGARSTGGGGVAAGLRHRRGRCGFCRGRRAAPGAGSGSMTGGEVTEGGSARTIFRRQPRPRQSPSPARTRKRICVVSSSGNSRHGAGRALVAAQMPARSCAPAAIRCETSFPGPPRIRNQSSPSCNCTAR